MLFIIVTSNLIPNFSVIGGDVNLAFKSNEAIKESREEESSFIGNRENNSF